MPRKNKPTPVAAPAERAFFINPETERLYVPLAGRADTNIILPSISWRSTLSHNTPRVAELLLLQGSNLIAPRSL